MSNGAVKKLLCDPPVAMQALRVGDYDVAQCAFEGIGLTAAGELKSEQIDDLVKLDTEYLGSIKDLRGRIKSLGKLYVASYEKIVRP